MIWVVILGFIAFFLVLFGCWLTMSRVRKYREAAESNRVRAFADMEKLAAKKETRGRGDAGTRGEDLTR